MAIVLSCFPCSDCIFQTRINLTSLMFLSKCLSFSICLSAHLVVILTIIIIIFISTSLIELTHSKTILEITVEIEPQPAALDFKNLSQYSSHSK